MNIHRFVKIVLQGQGRPAPTESDQRKLVKWLIFCDRWPDLIDKVLESVKDEDKPSENPIADMADPDSEAGKFASQITEDDVLTADDLASDGALAQAASISHHVIVWKSAASHAASDDASAQPEGKAGKPGDPEATSGENFAKLRKFGFVADT